MAEYVFSAGETATGLFHPEELLAELRAANLPVTVVAVRLAPFDRSRVTVVTDADVGRPLLEVVVGAHTGAVATLARVKAQRARVVDRRTQELIRERGFEHPASSGQVFSLAPDAQRSLARLFADRANLVYPLVVSMQDNAGELSLPGATAFEAFHSNAVAAIRAWEDGGVTLKRQIRDAATVAEVRAVVDTR